MSDAYKYAIKFQARELSRKDGQIFDLEDQIKAMKENALTACRAAYAKGVADTLEKHERRHAEDMDVLNSMMRKKDAKH